MPEIEKSQELEKSVFATIAYYDYFNYPLTAVEIYQYLIKFSLNTNPNFKTSDVQWTSDVQALNKPKFFEIIKILDENEDLKKFISQKNGFYFLSGREEIIKQRIQKKKLTDQKFKKTKWILRFISYLPFVRLIMISGSMGLGNPLKESDIDLLIVAKAGRIWTARAIITFFALIFGKYRHTRKTQNRLCLNHYITDKSLGIDFGNLYKAQEYLNILHLAGDAKIYKNFLEENGWIKDYALFSSKNFGKNLREFASGGIFSSVKKFFEFLLSGFAGDYFEKVSKKFQIFFIEKNLLTKNPRARIRYGDNSLVFHPVLIEPEVIGKWKEKMAEFNIKMS